MSQFAENLDAVVHAAEQRKPLIGDLEAMESLRAEYVNGSQAFVRKIDGLSGEYTGLRRTRGDGNCFFRSFLYAYLEYLLLRNDEVESQRFVHALEAAKGLLLRGGYEELVTEDAMSVALSHANGIVIAGTGIEGSMDAPTLLANFRDAEVSNSLVMLLRFIVSAEIKTRAEHFAPFVLGQYDVADVDAFCQRHVDVMGEESDHIHAQALTDALRVPLRIVQIDSGHGGAGADAAPANVVDMAPEDAASEAERAPPRVTLLHRPGHYDILYPASGVRPTI